MKKISILCLLCFTVGTLLSQEETANWAFGNNAGLSFNLETGTVIPTVTAINTAEGCSSISDQNGDLLFYTDGRTVWDRNNQIMPNADYFGGSGLLGDPSSTSSGVIVPHPTNTDLYYIFTVDEPHHNNAWAFPNQGPADQNGNPIPTYQETFGNFQTVPQDDDGFNNGFNYSLVDMTLNGGFGDVVPTEKNVQLITFDPAEQDQVQYKCAEKITAVQGADCESFWVITQFVDTFYAFRIDSNGFNNTTPVVSANIDPFITTQGYRRNGIGYMKSSPDGTKIAVCHAQNSTLPSDNFGDSSSGSFWLYDFDSATGIVSNPVNLISNIQCYGTEFSSDSRKVYVSNGNQVRQFDLDNNNAGTVVFTAGNSNAFISAMQLAPNNRIYVCNSQGPSSLDVIERPNEAGIACSYAAFGQALAAGTSASLGLPPFITSLLNSQIDIIRNGESTTELRLCTGEDYTLQADDLPGADYTWSFNGTPLPDDGFELLIDTPGFYEVFIEPNNGECPIEGSAVVGIFDIPVANPVSNVSVCDDSGNDGITTFDFRPKDTEILLAQNPTEFNVNYFETFEDAELNENALSFPYTNTLNPQTIFVRIENVNNPRCSEITSFELQVFDTPQIFQNEPIEFCDNTGDITDGIATIDFNTIIPLIRGNQSETETAVSFHLTQDDADDNLAALPLLYTNTGTPVDETIYVRIENTLNPECFSTDSFPLIVNNAPEAIDVSLFQCDEDGIPEGFTLFNLTEINGEVTANAANVSVEFFLNQDDLDNDLPISEPNSFQNFENPQTLLALVTDNTSGCTNTGNITLEVSATQTNNASIGLCDDDGTEDGFTTFNLTDANPIILAGAPTGLSIAYYETYEDALIEANPLNSNYTNSTAFNQTVFARVENANACYGISEIELTIFELPNIETEADLLYCLNFFPEDITLNGGIIDGIPNNFLYEWSTGETTIEIDVNEVGTYTVVVRNTNGCSKTRTINVAPSNIATVTDVQIVDATDNNTVTVFVTGEGDYEYAIQSIGGPYQDSNTFENLSPGIYTIYIRDKNDCGIVEEDVSVIGFPKFFTPNNDNFNDFWQIKGISDQFQPNSKVLIFDRYGKLLKELNPLGPGWDGRYNGALMPTNDYWFKVTLQDGRTYTSHFTLKR